MAPPLRYIDVAISAGMIEHARQIGEQVRVHRTVASPIDTLVQCFALTGTYRSQKRACGKAQFAGNAGGLGKNCNAATSLFLASRRASRQGAICLVAWP